MFLLMLDHYVIKLSRSSCTNLNIDIAIIDILSHISHIINLLSSPHYSFLTFPRDSRGGGSGIIYKSHITIISTKHTITPNAEFVIFSLRNVGSKHIKCIVVYRFPDSSFSSFIIDFFQLVDSTNTNDIIDIGDFNIHMNKSHISMTNIFQSTLIRHSLIQNVDFSTNVSGNTIDLIITKDSSSFVSNSQAELILITMQLPLIMNYSSQLDLTYRKLSQIDLNNLMSDICLNFVQNSSTPLIDIVNNNLETTLNEHAPMKSLFVTE